MAREITHSLIDMVLEQDEKHQRRCSLTSWVA